jgi:hypothetical protein
MKDPEDSEKQMEENKDHEEDSLPALIDKPNTDFLAQLLGSCGIVSRPAVWSGHGVETLQSNPLCFIALVVGNSQKIRIVNFESRNSIRKVEPGRAP